MEKINFDFFEFFGAVLPGIPIFILSCFLITSTPFSFIVIVESIRNVTLSEITIAAIACYCIGFCFHHWAYEIFQPVVKLFGDKRTKGLPISIGKREKELVFIRQKSPQNFKTINKFLALRQMSYTLFLSLLICDIALVLLPMFCNDNRSDIFSAIAITSILSWLFLRRAVAFHQRIQEMISETYKFCRNPYNS